MAINYHEIRQKRKTIPVWPSIFLLMAVVALIVLMAGFACAGQIPEDKAIQAIIGEAEAEDFSGMMAIGCALRNRGSLKGVYGLNAPRVKKMLYSTRVARLARLAWLESAKKDITNGATGWGSESDLVIFKRQGWFNRCVITKKIGGHYFYRKA